MSASDLFLGLVLFAVLLGMYTAVMRLLVLRIPYLPTPHRAVRAMVDLAVPGPGDIVYDLGAGDGRVLIAAKRRCRRITAIGCEQNIAIWLLGRIRSLLSGHIIHLHLHDPLQENLRTASVIFLYVHPGRMEQMEEKFERELQPGTRVVSYAFSLPGRQPQRELNVTGGRVFLYVW